MAIKQVTLPRRPQYPSSSSESIYGNIGKAGQVLGTAGVLTGNPILAGAGAVLTTGSSLLNEVNKPKQPDIQKDPRLVETRDVAGDTAMNRRMTMQKESPDESLDYGIAAIENLNIPDDQKQRLLKPMLMAKQARV